MSSMAVPQSLPVMQTPRGHGGRGARSHGDDLGSCHVRKNVSTTSEAISQDAAEQWSRGILTVIAVVAVVVMALAGMRIVGAQQAGVAFADGVGGHVLAAPGEQLVEIAARTKPNGADLAIYLAQVEALNVRAEESTATQWRVVLLPAQ